MAPQLAPIEAALRETDPDSYITLLYAPADRRAGLASLYAFDREIARVRDRVRDALPGELRLQWWRDVIMGGVQGVATGHPIADALISTIEGYSLPKPAFENYLEARIFDLYNDPMPSRVDLEGYCGETSGAIIQLACLMLDRSRAPEAVDLSGHAGCAATIADILRELQVHRARGQCFIPADILSAAGLTVDGFLSGEPEAKNGAAFQAMSALAREHLNAFQIGAKRMPANLLPAFLRMAIVPERLSRLSRAGNSSSASTDASLLRKHWLTLVRAVRGWS